MKRKVSEHMHNQTTDLDIVVVVNFAYNATNHFL